ncbi:phosphoglycerate mutase-like protein [Gossypium arboreum]|nr:phosphoglycerate mutase-like protein [Gossypium arboreum]
MASTSRELSNNEKRLHLMRHAHELHNSKEETNPQLSPLGSQQVRDERKNLSASGVLQSIELIVTSPLTRTLQTSVGVFLGSEEHGDNCNNPIIIATELCRVRMIESEYDISWEAEERETDEAVAARAVEFIGWLLARKEKEIAVVSHGGFLKQTLLAIGHKCDPLVTCDNFTP